MSYIMLKYTYNLLRRYFNMYMNLWNLLTNNQKEQLFNRFKKNYMEKVGKQNGQNRYNVPLRGNK